MGFKGPLSREVFLEVRIIISILCVPALPGYSRVFDGLLILYLNELIFLLDISVK
jgi:hypothetical protein